MSKHVSRLRVVVASVFVAASVLSASANATQPECQVVNTPPKKTLYTSNSHANPLGTAIAEAEAGDTLQVIGTCHGNFLVEKDLTIEGRPSATHTDTIGGDGVGPVLHVPYSASGVDLMVKDLTITGGTGGITAYYAHLVTVTNVTVTGNAGTGIANWGSSPFLIENTVVSDNHAAGNGGGIYNSLAAMTISNSTVSQNTATGSGGGISDRGNLTVVDSVVSGNTASASGGGIANSGVATLVNSTVSGNNGDSGGGIFNSGGAVTLTNSVVTENTAGYSSGGIENNNYYDDVGTLTLVNSTLSNNDADFKWGGLGNFGVATITDSTVSGNTAGRGGGGITNWDTLVLTNSLVAGNYGDMGGGILNVGTAALTDTTVTGNTASITGGGIFNAEGFGTLALYGTSTVSGNVPNDIVTGPF